MPAADLPGTDEEHAEAALIAAAAKILHNGNQQVPAVSYTHLTLPTNREV